MGNPPNTVQPFNRGDYLMSACWAAFLGGFADQGPRGGLNRYTIK